MLTAQNAFNFFKDSFNAMGKNAHVKMKKARYSIIYAV